MKYQLIIVCYVCLKYKRNILKTFDYSFYLIESSENKNICSLEKEKQKKLFQQGVSIIANAFFKTNKLGYKPIQWCWRLNIKGYISIDLRIQKR